MSSPISPRAYPNYTVSTRTPRMMKTYLGDTRVVPFVYETKLGGSANPNLGDGVLNVFKPDGNTDTIDEVSAEHSTYKPIVNFDQLGIWKLCLTFNPQEAQDTMQLITIVQEVRVVDLPE